MSGSSERQALPPTRGCRTSPTNFGGSSGARGNRVVANVGRGCGPRATMRAWDARRMPHVSSRRAGMTCPTSRHAGRPSHRYAFARRIQVRSTARTSLQAKSRAGTEFHGHRTISDPAPPANQLRPQTIELCSEILATGISTFGDEAGEVMRYGHVRGVCHTHECHQTHPVLWAVGVIPRQHLEGDQGSDRCDWGP